MVFSKLNTTALMTLMDNKFCISIADRNGVIIYVNRNFCELSGYSEMELIGRGYDIVNPDYKRLSFVEEMELFFSTATVWEKKVKAVSKDGSYYWVNATIIPITDASGEILQYLSVDVDNTTRELSIEKYNETLRNLRNIEDALDFSSVVAITNPKGIITHVNDKFCTLSKYTRDELIGKTHRIVNSNYHPKSFFEMMWSTIQRGEIWQGDICNKAKDGSIYWVSTTIVPFMDAEGKPEQYIAIRHDITDRKKAEESLEIALQNDFQTTVKNLENAIFKYILTDKGEIEFTLLEGQIKERIGISIEQLNNHEVEHHFSNKEIKTFKHHLLAAMSGDNVQFELTYKGLSFLVYLSPIFHDREVVEVVGTALDITQRIEAEKVIEHMAYYDYLTDLPNRRRLQEIVNHKVTEPNENFALLFLDLDRFKSVNDSLGHHVGDQLLMAVADRLRDCRQDGEIVSRLSGDEFIIIVNSAETGRLTSFATKVIDELSQPYHLGNHEVFIAPSIGISLYPKDGEDYNMLMRNADSAMYFAKQDEKNQFRFFTQELHEEIIEKSLLEMELRLALEKEQFTLYYQPQYDLTTSRITGLEALARWEHPVRGAIPPSRFIPIAEENGFILSLGNWVLKQACIQAKAWQNKGKSPLRMSVNVSMRQFKQPSFVEDVKKILIDTQLDPIYLNLEITESMMSDVLHCQPVLQELNAAGISVSIDDFGTGYSSFLYLSKFPISHLKIDQAFIRELNKNNTMIVKAIIDLAKNLQLNVIAEGVETKDQEHFLKQLHCHEVQGFLYAKPLPQDEIEKLLM